MTRFIDSNVFIHALLQPTRTLKPHETEIKESAKKILTKINKDEVGATSTAHISEIANILEARIGQQKSAKILQSITNMQNLTIYAVTETHVKAAATIAPTLNLGFNDTLAYLLMQEKQLDQIYSFDKDFDSLPDIERVH